MSVSVLGKDAVTRSGSLAMTASEVGPSSEIRSTFAFSLFSDDSTGSVQVAVPTIVSAIPRESWISVED